MKVKVKRKLFESEYLEEALMFIICDIQREIDNVIEQSEIDYIRSKYSETMSYEEYMEMNESLFANSYQFIINSLRELQEFLGRDLSKSIITLSASRVEKIREFLIEKGKIYKAGFLVELVEKSEEEYMCVVYEAEETYKEIEDRQGGGGL